MASRAKSAVTRLQKSGDAMFAEKKERKRSLNTKDMLQHPTGLSGSGKPSPYSQEPSRQRKISQGGCSSSSGANARTDTEANSGPNKRGDTERPSSRQQGLDTPRRGRNTSPGEVSVHINDHMLGATAADTPPVSDGRQRNQNQKGTTSQRKISTGIQGSCGGGGDRSRHNEDSTANSHSSGTNEQKTDSSRQRKISQTTGPHEDVTRLRKVSTTAKPAGEVGGTEARLRKVSTGLKPEGVAEGRQRKVSTGVRPEGVAEGRQRKVSTGVRPEGVPEGRQRKVSTGVKPESFVEIRQRKISKGLRPQMEVEGRQRKVSFGGETHYHSGETEARPREKCIVITAEHDPHGLLDEKAQKYINMHGMSPHKVKEYGEAFVMIDKSNTRTITRLDLYRAMLSLGHDEIEAERETNRIMLSSDASGNGLLDFGEFILAMHLQTERRKRREEQYNHDLLEAFQFFDKDGNGYLDRDELRNIMISLGAKEVKDDEVDEMMREADLNGDGNIQYEEFYHMMKKLDS